MLGDNMKFASIIVGIVFFIMLIKGVFESGLWAILVFLFIIVSMLKDKNKKKYRKKKKNNRKISPKVKIENASKSDNDFANYQINFDKYKSNNKYKSESINQTEEFLLEKKKIARLRQMKTLTVGSNFNKSQEPNKLFFLQASFMDDFQDDYDINVPCKLYSPVYNNLNMYQLRSFFSWRTLIRQGIYKKTEVSYVYLYIYELLNKIGVKNEIDGLNKLIELWQNYRQFDQSIDRYLTIWIKDYYIINQINIEYKLIEDEFPIKKQNNSTIISEIMVGNYDKKLNFFDSISSYHILSSKIMEHKYSFLLDLIIPEIFKNLDKYFNENNYSFNKILFGELKQSEWLPFKGAIYYDNNLLGNSQITLNGYEKYYKIKNNYYKETFEFSDESKWLMGYILKNIEIILRECLKFSRNLKANINMLEPIKVNENLYKFLIDKRIIDIINNTIKKYLIEHKNDINRIVTEEQKKEIIIDSKQFDDIRASSNRVQEKLIVEEENIEPKRIEELTEIEQFKLESDNIFTNLIVNLNEIEKNFLTLILSNENKQNLIDFCKKNNILYEIMLENINNKSLEIIGDNLIEDCENEVIIYAEYIDSIKINIGGM